MANPNHVVVLIAILIAINISSITAYLNPHKDPLICGRPVCNEIRKFNFTKDTEYEYIYTVDVRSLFSGSSKNESTLYIKSIATIVFQHECEATLSLKNIKLSEKADSYNKEEDWDIESPAHPQNEHFEEALSQYPLRFAFHDGAISEICPEQEEPNWVINFKRGLLSMFQNTMRRFDMDHNMTETDVNGVCNTGYLLKGAQESSLIINKYKDISTCQSRYKYHSILQTTPYVFRSKQNDIPLMKSSSHCEMVIDHSIYTNIVCTERHLFQPFSSHDSGATTITVQQLRLLKEQAVAPNDIDEVPSRKTLLYDHLPTPKPSSGELKQSRNMLKEMCAFSKTEIQIQFSDVFSKFIQYARLLSTNTLTLLFNRANQICDTGKKHILDALPFLGTDASVQVMKDILINRGVDETVRKEWLLSFSFIPRPSVVMLETMLPILEMNLPEPVVSLSAGTMVHMYCRWSPDCGSEPSVFNILSYLEHSASKCYKSRFDDPQTHQRLLVSIKALGNTGLLSEPFRVKLESIIEDSDVPMEIRLAAINAFHRTDCTESQQYFMKMYQKFDADTEIRIAAYLQFMRCPNYMIIQKLRYTLISEEVNQVGSFVWTHLNNLLKSSIPSRVEIQGLLSDKDLGRKFSSDFRKFSHNYEGSVYFEEYNVGGNYEINTIFSPKSYVPRSLSLNLTVDLFGESINLFEVNSRLEGFEHYLESLFGPNRTFSAKNLKEKVDNMHLFKRSIDDTAEIRKQISQMPNVVKDNFIGPQASVGVKVFGNELLYKSLVGDRQIYEALQTLNPVIYLKRILSGKEISYNKAIVFLDASYIVPTGAGLPISLNAAGTGAINLKMKGLLRTSNFLSTGELDVNGYLRPSLAVDVIGTMSVDAYYASCGIKLKTNLYSSSDVEGEIKIRGTKLISFQFRLPQNKTEIFGAQSELIVMKGDKEEYQNDVTGDPVNKSYCSWEILDRYVGLKLCTTYKFPNATTVQNRNSSFIFHGPTKSRMFIEKVDSSAKIYLLQYRWLRTNSSQSMSIMFDTPGSKINRLSKANVTLNFAHQNVSILLSSADNNFSAVGNYRNTDLEKMLDLTLDLNGQKHFIAEIGYKVEPTKHGNTYYPKFYLSVNSERIAELKGSLKWVSKKNVSQCDVDLIFETKKMRTQWYGYISKSENLIETNLKIDYKFDQKKEETVKVNFKVNYIRKTLFKSIVGDFALETTAYPHLNFVSALKYQKASGHIECKIEVNNGPNMNQEANKLTILTIFSCFKTNNGTKLNALLSVLKPSNQIDIKLQFQHSQMGAEMNSRALVRYAQNREIVVTLYFSRPLKPLLEIDMVLNVTLPSFQPAMLEIQIDEKSKDVYGLFLKGVWFSGHLATAEGHYQDRCTPKKSDHIIKLRITSPSFTDVIADGQYYRDDQNFKLIAVFLHEEDTYSLLLRHTIFGTGTDINSYAEIQYKKQIYSATSTIEIRDKRQITLELHIDQLRDIYISLDNINLPDQKRIGGHIKWDSNRDPTQKLGGHIEYYRYAPFNTSANFLFTYPGRVVNGFYALAFKDTKIRSSAKFAWSPKHIIDVTLNSDFKHNDEEILLLLQSQLLTPFPTWEKTSCNGLINHRDNLYRINGSVFWRSDQFISTDLYTNYSISANVTEGEFKTSLVSTIQDVPSIACQVKHHQDDFRLDQKFYLMYNTKHVIRLNNTWKLEKAEDSNNLAGTISLSSPFDGYKRGILQSKIKFTRTRNIRGYASLDLDSRHYTATCEGHLTKLTDNLFVFNVTTPMEKYKRVNGRFGFNEEEKHLVAVVKYPQGACGVEVLFLFNSLSNFNLLLDVATPLDFLTKLLLIGKLQPDAIDFRLGWNEILVGFSGIWRYINNTNFEHAYKLYTPIEGVEENGIVARLIYENGLDLEASIQLAETKLGVVILGKPKPKLLQGIGLKPPEPILLEPIERLRPLVESVEDEGPNDHDFDEDISWNAQIELNIVIYPTIKGNFDLDQFGDMFTLIGTVTLPDGDIDIRDELQFEDLFTMNNRLLVSTPFRSYKQITSKFDLEIVMERAYLVGFNFNYQNRTEWVQTGCEVSYLLILSDGDELQSHRANIHLHSPFVTLPHLDLIGRLNIDENHYRGNVSLDTVKTHLNLAGSIEKDEGFLDSSLHLNMSSPFLTIRPTVLMFRKDFSEIENSVEFLLDKEEEELKNPFKFELMWRKPIDDQIYAKFKIQTPAQLLKTLELLAHISKSATTTAQLKLQYNLYDVEVNGSLSDNVIRSEVTTFIEPYKTISLVLNQTPDPAKPGMFHVKGQMFVKKEIVEIGGVYMVKDDLLVYVKLQSINGLQFEYRITPQTDGNRIYINMADTVHKTYLNLLTKIEFKHKLDWKLKLSTESTNPKWNDLGLETELLSPVPNNITLVVNLMTHLEGLEGIHTDFNLLMLPDNAGIGKVNYALDAYKGSITTHWNWILVENMQLKLLADYDMPDAKKNFETHLFYVNPERSFKNFKTGADFVIDKHNWAIGSNLSLTILGAQTIDGLFNLKLPNPGEEVHTAHFKIHNNQQKRSQDAAVNVGYSTLNSKAKYGLTGSMKNNQNERISGNLKVEWGPNFYQNINNTVDVTKNSDGIYDLSYRLRTPKYLKEDTFVSDLSYGYLSEYHKVKSIFFFPDNQQIFSAKVNYKEFSNMNGTVNSTTPFITFPYLGVDFDSKATGLMSKRHVLVFWPNNTATFDSIYNYVYKNKNRGGNGHFEIQVPLSTRHYLQSNYGYNERPNHKNGYATVDYNKVNIVDAKYACASQLRAGFQKDVINLEIENKLQPIGVNYIHQVDTGLMVDGFAPNVDFKRAEFFKLNNKTAFNITGELTVETTLNGEKYKLMAHHVNRTMSVFTEYEILDQQFLNSGKIQLAPDIWFGYDMNLINKTYDLNSESQQIEIELSYPRRNVTAIGSYNCSKSDLSSVLSLTWDKHLQVKNVEGAFEWKQISVYPNYQQAIFEIRHPSFEKNVTFLGEYKSDAVHLADLKLEVEYSLQPENKLELTANLEDHCKGEFRNYTFNVTGKHEATNLQLKLNGGLDYYSKYYHTFNQAEYKRTYLPLQSSENSATINIRENELEFKKATQRDLTYFWTKADGHYPIYTMNLSAIYGEDTNATGEFYLNFHEKLVKLEGNRTPEATETVHMLGEIPSARSANFRFWRDYDDIRIYDISYYLQLNHSRLITSRLLWRPELKTDIKEGFKSASESLYLQAVENIEYWKQYIRSETGDAIADIWADAKPIVQECLDDINDLNVLEEDVEKFKIFLNESYNNNEFYIRDIVGFAVYLIDELAIRDHLESVPEIVNELWEIMGESGKALKKSIQWLVKTIKESYKKLVQFMNDLMKGEALEQLSKIMEYFIEKYDKFIKNLHVAFIKYMDKLWNDTSAMLVNQWNRLLAAIEPTFLKFIHYGETVIWNASKEFLDFLYKRKHEIEESPYFTHLANFTQDIDKFYKDIMSKSIISNIKKYTKIIYNFLKEKYFSMVPFGKELSNIFNEIVTELQELKKLPSVQFVISKYDELYEKAEWLYDYFQISERLQKIILVLHMKITEITQTALESENKYREAKTMFIFDPETGIVELEQKLPMSWHAFNETPKFMEIPEIKTINDIQNYVVMSNKSFWMLYYQYKPYTEPHSWIPPFDSYAMVIGPQRFITFDGEHYDFSGTCSYLLANDFQDGNFSAVITYENEDNVFKHKIDLIVDNVLIEIDLFANTVKLMRKGVIAKLPLQLKKTFIYQEADIIVIESQQGFTLKCNMQFDICKFHLSGYYFGKTGGLLGTMNNEPKDDFLASSHKIQTNVGRFAQSWSLQPTKCRSTTNQAKLITAANSEEVIQLCESFFRSKVSPLSVCYPIVDATPFYDLCVGYPSGNNKTSCSAAVAYMEACALENTPLRIPDSCVRCKLPDGSEVSEGEFVMYEGKDVPKSADIVFIVEAKNCNANITQNRNINQLINLMEKELQDLKLTENRYALVTFGGSGIFSEPRNIIYNNNIFTDAQNFIHFFENIPTGYGSSDIFSAITFAKTLLFRPGVSKTMILLPCTDCQPDYMKLDYPVMHQLLREYDITLHILMNSEFVFQKARIAKIFYGIDSTTSFTKNDVKELKGDEVLRKQVKLPKADLGFCASLALETNGSIFTANKLETDKKRAVKKFTTVLAKRLAATAIPNKCSSCECTADSEGTSYMECLPCEYPSALTIDYGFNDDDGFLSILQTGEIEDDSEESDD